MKKLDYLKQRQFSLVEAASRWATFAAVDEKCFSDEDSLAHVQVLGFSARLSAIAFFHSLLIKDVNASPYLLLKEAQMIDHRLVDRALEVTEMLSAMNIVEAARSCYDLNRDIKPWWDDLILVLEQNAG